MDRYLRRHQFHPEIEDRLVLIDQDRIDEDQRQGRDPKSAAGKSGIRIVLQTPNLEGVLLRLHPNMEQRVVAPRDAESELRKVWPEYAKPPTASQLHGRFTVADLERVAKYDSQLRKLLVAVGLARTRPAKS